MDFAFAGSAYPPQYGGCYAHGHPAAAGAATMASGCRGYTEEDVLEDLLDGLAESGSGIPAAFTAADGAARLAAPAFSALPDDGFLDGLLDELCTMPTAPAPAKKPPRKRAGVRFGGVDVRYITPAPDDHPISPAANAAAGFSTTGFGPLGSVGEMEAYEAQALGWGIPAEPRRPCAPLSASRLVQRRWRANAAAGHR